MYLNHLNTRNGNPYILDVYANNNNLSCIQVDNIGYFNKITGHMIHLQLWIQIVIISNQCNIYGCMDPLALNYDPTATIDDGVVLIVLIVPLQSQQACMHMM